MYAVTNTAPKADGRVVPWNKGKLIGQKPPLKLKEIWAIRISLQLNHRARELALFNLAIDSKLRGCDLVGVFTSAMCSRAVMLPTRDCHAEEDPAAGGSKISEQTRDAVGAWIAAARLKPEQFLFPSRMSASPHLSTQYSRIVRSWAGSIGLDPAVYGTHSMRRTKPTLIYRRTRNLRAVQLRLIGVGGVGWGCDAARLDQMRFRNADYDAAYEAFVRTPPGLERNALARRMSEIVAARAPILLRATQ